MKKKQLLAIVVPLIFVLMLCQATTATYSIQIKTILGYAMFRYLHVLPGFGLVILVLIHAWANWDWLESMYFTRKKKPAHPAPPAPVPEAQPETAEELITPALDIPGDLD